MIRRNCYLAHNKKVEDGMKKMFNLNTKQKTVSLYTILEIQEKMFGVNDEIKQVYDYIREKRIERMHK